MFLLKDFKTHGTEPEQQPITSNPEYVQIADMLGQLVIVKIAQHGAGVAKIVESQFFLRKFVATQKLKSNGNQDINNVDNEF